MQLNSEQQKWVARFTGGSAGTPLEDLDLVSRLRIENDREATRDQALRELHVQRVHDQLDDLKTGLRDAFRFEVETKRGKRLKTMGKGGDQTKAYDTFNDKGLKALEADRIKLLWEAQTSLRELTEGLRQITTTATVTNRENTDLVTETVQLFGDAQIAAEVYTPMVRELVIPENFVPDAFSETQEMLDASSEFYLKELEEYEDTRKPDVSTFKNLVNSGAGLTKAIVALPGFKDQKDLVGAVATLTQCSLNVGAELYVNVRTKGGIKAAAGAVLSGMATGAEAAVVQFSGLDKAMAKDVGKVVKHALQFSGHSVKAIDALCAREGPDIDKALDSWVSSIGCAFDIGSVLPSGETDDGADARAAISVSGKALTNVARAFVQAKRANIVKAIQSGDWTTVTTYMSEVTVLVGETALAGSSAGMRRALEREKDETTDDTKKAEIDARLKEIKLADKTLLKAMPDARAKLNGLKSSMANLDAVRDKLRQSAEAADRETAAKEARQAEEILRAEQEAFQADLETLGQGEHLKDSELKSISRLIAKMKRDRAIMETAATVGKAGFAIASQFCGPLKIGGTLVKFLHTLTAAVERAIHWRKWYLAQKDALAGVSPYLTSIKNFIDNQKAQFTHYTIKAALILVQVAAQIAQAVGAAVSHGTVALVAGIVDKGAALAESLEEALYKFVKRIALAVAWKKTQKALKNPRNRKAGLIVRRMNPTLAKYTIAWGAVVKKDSIAQDAVGRCGLTREVLCHREANVGKVKEFLQELYSEDNVVLGKLPGGLRSWTRQLPTPALSLVSWSHSYQVAITQGDLRDDRPRLVERAFMHAEQCEGAYELKDSLLRSVPEGTDTAAATREAREAGEALAEAWASVENAMIAWTPLKKGLASNPSKDMVAVRDAYEELAAARRYDLEDEISERFDMLDPVELPLAA